MPRAALHAESCSVARRTEPKSKAMLSRNQTMFLLPHVKKIENKLYLLFLNCADLQATWSKSETPKRNSTRSPAQGPAFSTTLSPHIPDKSMPWISTARAICEPNVINRGRICDMRCSCSSIPARRMAAKGFGREPAVLATTKSVTALLATIKTEPDYEDASGDCFANSAERASSSD